MNDTIKELAASRVKDIRKDLAIRQQTTRYWEGQLEAYRNILDTIAEEEARIEQDITSIED